MMRIGAVTFFSFFLVSILLVAPQSVFAETAAEIQAQIDNNNEQLKALQAEIADYQKQLDVLGGQKSTLQSAINTLALSQKQLASQIQVTQNKIASANLQIKDLTSSIGDKESAITSNKNAIGKALRSIAESEQSSLITKIISSDSLSDAWQLADQALQFNRALTANIATLRTIRTTLATNRDAVTDAKSTLLSLQNDLSGQKRSVDASKNAQQQLLSQTKNKESNYQKLIAEKKTAEQSFENELIALQTQLNLIVNPGSLPKVGTGLLSWPFTVSFMNVCASRNKVFGNAFCITQYFGNTPFATANPQIYNNHGHSAIDFGASDGTPVLAALSGTVIGTGNTDLAHDPQGRQCYSFGKWVMIDHKNGLSTMYAHLSKIDVSIGQTISTRQTIGISGRTGYATGPHLHFGVYATEGTQIMTLGQFKGNSGTRCEHATMPVASLDAYLNPLSYL